MATVLTEAYHAYMQLSWILTVICGHVKGDKWDLDEGHTCMYNESEDDLFFATAKVSHLIGFTFCI